MMLLVSGATKTVARISDPRLGNLLRPGNGNRPDARPWAVDNGAFAGFEEAAFERLLARLVDIPGCLWVAAPDVVADAEATLASFVKWEPRIRSLGFDVVFVLQDGQRAESIPWERLECLFIGGSTEYKMGAEARAFAAEAKRRGKLVHMGRVNSLRRLRYADAIGCDSVDGTKYSRFADTHLPRALRALRRLADQQRLFERLS